MVMSNCRQECKQVGAKRYRYLASNPPTVGPDHVHSIRTGPLSQTHWDSGGPALSCCFYGHDIIIPTPTLDRPFFVVVVVLFRWPFSRFPRFLFFGCARPEFCLWLLVVRAAGACTLFIGLRDLINGSRPNHSNPSSVNFSILIHNPFFFSFLFLVSSCSSASL